MGGQPEPAEEPQRTGNGVRAAIAAFLAGHTTLTLATVDSVGSPAAAAVFFAFDWPAPGSLRLFFLSEERTVHGRNLLANPEVAGTIQADGQDWRTIRGLQLRGAATLVPASALPHAFAVYGRRFAFVGALLAGRNGPAVLTGPLARARLWVLRPTWLRLTDNTVRFGYKDELILEGDQ